MNRITKPLVLLLLLIPVISGGCKKEVEPKVEVADEISRFVWNGLNQYYLWYANVEKLSPDYFDTNDDWYSFLNSYGTDYEGLFYDLLYSYPTIDRFSWIVDDYVALENSFAGISKTMGYDFRLVRFSGSDNIFGYVRYVIPGSPAFNAGITRGDLFMMVDGQQLNINNYYSLLIEQESYSLGMASYDAVENSIGTNGTTYNLTAVELQENPIHYSSIIETGGMKIAYLVYNGFTSDFDFDLNNQFAYYQAQGVDKMILDLRYNGGGSIQSAIYLASMIYSNSTSTVFSKVNYNDKLQDYFRSTEGDDYFNYYFTDLLEATDQHEEAPLVSLGLNELYVIVTGGTASASELVINGLEPYIDVKLFGETTLGKNVGSITVKDWNSQGVVNPNHKWAMQPIILQIANSAGFTDYINGLAPDVQVEEDIVALQPFGNENEDMLKAVLDYILGVPTTKSLKAGVKGVDYEVIAGSKDFTPFSRDMYLDKPLIIK